MTPLKQLATTASVSVTMAATLVFGTAPDLDASTVKAVRPVMVLARDYCVTQPTSYLPVQVVDHVMATCAAGMFVSVAGPNTTPHLKSPYVVQVRDFCVAESMGLSAVQVNRFGVVSCSYGTLVTVALDA